MEQQKIEPHGGPAVVVRRDQAQRTEFDWGVITFYANDVVGSVDAMSVGKCEVYPGRALPRHYHPNCIEIVRVTRGTILHTVEGDRMEVLNEGDTLIVPVGMVHQGSNPGTETAEMQICFSAGHREFIPV